MKNKSKKQKIIELISYISEDDTLDSCVADKNIKVVCYAPHISYFAWIFNYEGVLVSLIDMGNGHYAFYKSVTNFDVLRAQIINQFNIIKNKNTGGI